jgi:predicted TIM-barrel fold metal-dependent hydrolase
MARQYRIVSGDSHLEIDSKWWVDRIPAQHRDRAPRLVRLADGGDAWLVEGRPLRAVPFDLYGGKGRDNWKPFGQSYETTPGTGSPQQRLAEQDRDGIDAEVLFPGISGPPLWRAITDDAAYLATVRAYNDFLAEEYCAADPDRLIGLGAIPWTGVNDAVAEMEHCARKGLKGIALGTFPNGKGYPTREDDRFWAAALDLDMPITVHEELDRSEKRAGPYIQYPNAPKEMLEQISGIREFAGQVAKFGRLGAVNAVQLTMDGVFDRFPELKVFFAETQIGWVPFFFEMADTRYERHLPWAEELVNYAPLNRLPSEYIKEHCFWGFQHDRFGVLNRHHIGVDRVIWATDFPHQDSEYPNSMRLVDRDFAGVPEDEKTRMICANAVEYFHLDRA